MTAWGLRPPTCVLSAMPPNTSMPEAATPCSRSAATSDDGVVVVRLDDDRAHPRVGRALRGLRRVEPPRERRRIRMHMEVDGAVEQSIHYLAHAATSNVCSP